MSEINIIINYLILMANKWSFQAASETAILSLNLHKSSIFHKTEIFQNHWMQYGQKFSGIILQKSIKI